MFYVAKHGVKTAYTPPDVGRWFRKPFEEGVYLPKQAPLNSTVALTDAASQELE